MARAYDPRVGAWRRLQCRALGHAWEPYGPAPRYADYLPDVVLCRRCGDYRFATGDRLGKSYLPFVRPYPQPRREGEPSGWTGRTSRE